MYYRWPALIAYSSLAASGRQLSIFCVCMHFVWLYCICLLEINFSSFFFLSQNLFYFILFIYLLIYLTYGPERDGRMGRRTDSSIP